jgi:hypothetical protein
MIALHLVFEALGHLKRVTLARAAADMGAVGAYLEKTYPREFSQKTFPSHDPASPHSAGWASRVLAFIVYQATPRDPLVLAGVVVAMSLLGLLATWIPAQRALSVDPAILLRDE